MTPAEKLAKSKRHRNNTAFQSLPRIFECDLAERRERLGLSQRDVCRATGINVSTLCRVEQGIDVTLSRAVKLAEFFGCAVHEIWRRSPDGTH